MKSILEESGPQGSNPKARTRKPAHLAHRSGPVRRRIPLSTSGRTGADEIETQTGESSLPEFSLHSRVSAGGGLFDHLEVSAKHGYVKGSCEEIDLFREFAGAAPKDLKSEIASKRYGRLFSVAPDNGRLGKALTIRKAPATWKGIQLPAPPFSGRLVTFRKSIAESEFLCGISTELHLNPSLGLNLCPTLFQKPPSAVEAMLTQRPMAELERGLDGECNVVPEGLGPRCNAGMLNYLQSVYVGLDGELRRASRATDNLPMPGNIQSEDFSLRRVETYWEFSAPDAVSLVKKLAPSLRGFHKNYREREHGAKWEQAMDLETVSNAPSIKLFLSAGEAIRVYAKTANRIRFEVIHSPRAQNGLLPGGYRSPTLLACIDKLNVLRQKAAKRVNQVLSFLSEWAHETPQARASDSRFASRWFQCLGFSEASEQLLELLRANGRIVRGQCLPQELENMARRAKENGLIFFDESARAAYPVSFGTTLPISEHNLTDSGSESIPLGHKADTQPVAGVPKFPTPIRKAKGQLTIPPCPPFLERPRIKAPPRSRGRPKRLGGLTSFLHESLTM